MGCYWRNEETRRSTAKTVMMKGSKSETTQHEAEVVETKELENLWCVKDENARRN